MEWRQNAIRWSLSTAIRIRAPRGSLLKDRLGLDETQLHISSYVSLDNGVSIKDVAEAFDRALATPHGLDGDFDAVVHSTGMLVVRAWLAADPLRRKSV